MFESSLQTFLKSDATLTSYVSSFSLDVGTTPAIFSEFAPESVVKPYLVYRINQSGNDNDKCVATFSIFFDFFGSGKSRVDSRAAMNRLQVILDRKVLEHARFNYIRFYYYSGSSVPEADPRSIHYNMQFYARAGRKNWIDYITT